MNQKYRQGVTALCQQGLEIYVVLPSLAIVERKWGEEL
jgi:hypothetical protein